ncbi:MAG: hypothetical protein ACTS4U_00240 [Candidatus Hodgkinia cicadicola]
MNRNWLRGKVLTTTYGLKPSQADCLRRLLANTGGREKEERKEGKREKKERERKRETEGGGEDAFGSFEGLNGSNDLEGKVDL